MGVDVETASEAGSDLSSLASDVESEKSAASAVQSEGSSHVSMMQQENGKPVSKNIFADDNAMGLEDLDSCTSDAHTTNGTSTRNPTYFELWWQYEGYVFGSGFGRAFGEVV